MTAAIIGSPMSSAKSAAPRKSTASEVKGWIRCSTRVIRARGQRGSPSGARKSLVPPNFAHSMNTQVDWFFNKPTRWQEEYAELRALLLSCGLMEELKWGCPCYTVNKKNVVLIHGFKDYCALLFHKGALLNDRHGILIQQTPNVQSARQVRFTGVKGIARLKPALIGYVNEAMALERAGSKVVLKKTKEFDMPEEFAARLKAAPALREAFEGLTPGRQRGYLLHFAAAKQSKTREARIEKHAERILRGKGLDD